MSEPTSAQKDHIKTAVKRDLRKICAAWPVAVDELDVVDGGKGDGSGVPDEDAEMQFRSRAAEQWIESTRGLLALVLRLARVERAGRFDPPALVGDLCRAAEALVEDWPDRIHLLFQRVAIAASVAGKHWPPTPRKGTVIDGVKVGDRGNFTEVCVECNGPIGANAEDPLARIDGKPYHRAPCYNTVKRRQRRAKR